MENKETLQKRKSELNNLVWEQTLSKNNEVSRLISEKVEPLRDEASRLEKSIRSDQEKIFAQQVAVFKEELKQIESELEKFAILEADGKFYPAGTLVYHWDTKGSFGRTLSRTGKTGIVHIFDGTQTISANTSWINKPCVGDIIVIHNKKNGTPGTIVSRLREYGFNDGLWLPENETPENRKKFH